MKIFRKENFLIFVSFAIFFYALFLNLCFPVQDQKTYDSKEQGLAAAFKTATEKFIPGDNSGLAFGYLLGDKAALPPGIDNKMKAIGMAHIIVVSGTHLSIIIGASRKLFSRISRLVAVFGSIFLIMGYVTLIGFTPSIIRASFVAILSLVAWYFGREQRPVRTVILTLGFCLSFNPYFLTNISFQLSMLAYSGVILVMPLLSKYFYGQEKPGAIGSLVLASLSAIVTCLPIQLYYFGSFNLIAILANLLILPTIPYAMAFAFFTGVLALLKLDFLATGMGWLAEQVLNYHVMIVNLLEEKTEFYFEFSKNEPVWLALYLVLFLIIFAIYQNVKVSKGNASDNNDSLCGVDDIEDVG
ncbi:ComEC/Rec2 family competence protein [Candidatus Saccharibacteria bacterium]|nr:ComEC/Rec2 family competence protein [Candidatus Saccharibacteria bacterium]